MRTRNKPLRSRRKPLRSRRNKRKSMKGGGWFTVTSSDIISLLKKFFTSKVYDTVIYDKLKDYINKRMASKGYTTEYDFDKNPCHLFSYLEDNLEVYEIMLSDGIHPLVNSNTFDIRSQESQLLLKKLEALRKIFVLDNQYPFAEYIDSVISEELKRHEKKGAMQTNYYTRLMQIADAMEEPSHITNLDECRIDENENDQVSLIPTGFSVF